MTLSRRQLLLTPLLYASGSFGANVSADEKAKLLVYYNDDATHLASLASPFHALKDDVTDTEIAENVKQAIDAGIDVYVLEPGSGWVPMWKSEVYPAAEHFDWFKKQYNVGPYGMDKYLASGGDIVKTVLQQCRDRGVAMIVSIRLNDEHNIEFSGRSLDYIHEHMNDSQVPGWQKTLPYSVSRVHADHPEWRFDASSEKPEDQIWDWSHREAVAHKAALILEVVDKYDIDGIELDYMRFPRFFSNETRTAARIEIMSAFISTIRRGLDARRRNRKLSIRVPPKVKALAELGLDLNSLSKLGVNRINVSSNTFTNQDIDFHEFRKNTSGMALCLELAHAKHFLMHQTPRRPDDDLLVTCAQIDDITTAWLGQTQGFNEVSLFNFPYYRRYGKVQPGRDSTHEPPFEVIRKLKQPGNGLKPVQSWYLSTVFTQGFEHYAQMPAIIKVGSPVTLRMMIAALKKPSKALMRFVVRERRSYDSTGTFSIFLNGALLSNATNPELLGLPEDVGLPFRALDLPPEHIRDGANIIRIEQDKGPQAEVALIEVLTQSE